MDEPEEEIDKNAWMATFSDLMFVLITFFVLLLSMSSLDAKSLDDTFGFFDGRFAALGGSAGGQTASARVQPPTPPVVSASQLDMSRDKKSVDGSQGDQGVPGENKEDTPSPESLSAVSADLLRLVSEMRNKREHVADLLMESSGSSRKERFKEASRLLNHPRYRKYFHLINRPDQITVMFAGDLLFKPGRVLIRPESLILLREISELLKQIEVDVRVVGVVPDEKDEVPARRDLYPSNYHLAVARGCNVVRYMMTYVNVPPQRLSCAVVAPAKDSKIRSSGVIFELQTIDH